MAYILLGISNVIGISVSILNAFEKPEGSLSLSPNFFLMKEDEVNDTFPFDIKIKRRGDVIMKNARVVLILLGIAFLMFVITPYASAQSVAGWFQGRASMRGYEVSGTGTIMGSASGSAPIYVNIADDTLNNRYLVTTCVEDSAVEGLWHWVPSVIPKSSVYGDPNSALIWDFANASGLEFYQNIYMYPMFYVRINRSGANFNSFSCGIWDDSNLPNNFQLGSCTITFKSVDPAKVPTSCYQPSPFHGTFNGSWSGTCASTYPVSGTFSVNIDGIGKVTGSYLGNGSGSILGTVDILGNLAAKGTAGSFSWVGQLALSNNSLSGAGSWSGKQGTYICNGVWSGSGTISP